MRSLALLLLFVAGLAAAAHDSIIVKMAEGGFAVQSGDELGQQVGDRLRRLRLPEGADAEAELARLRSMDGERAVPIPSMNACVQGNPWKQLRCCRRACGCPVDLLARRRRRRRPPLPS